MSLELLRAAFIAGARTGGDTCAIDADHAEVMRTIGLEADAWAARHAAPVPPVRLGTPIVAVFVPGLAETKGSWRNVGKGRFLPDNEREPAWAAMVGWHARLAMKRRGGALGEPVAIRVGIRLDFVLPFPPNRTKKHRRDGDKLARSVLDALQKIVYVDDEQVDDLHVTKSCSNLANALGVAIVVAPILGA